ncbi:hypothetical protein MAR_035591 [Mya arenaria]|uniref:Uncharacterized protein n=1 Tax=Mya arenaria TaxID=6604 RepID=A0ABY7EKY2_MYAAR|nr:hypothetical protein MAR_035591 [Mya arenaria]
MADRVNPQVHQNKTKTKQKLICLRRTARVICVSTGMPRSPSDKILSTQLCLKFHQDAIAQTNLKSQDFVYSLTNLLDPEEEILRDATANALPMELSGSTPMKQSGSAPNDQSSSACGKKKRWSHSEQTMLQEFNP